MLAEKLFPKALQSLKTCVFANDNLCGKLFSSLKPPTTFNEIFKVTSIPFFIPDFNYLSCELDCYKSVNCRLWSVRLSHFILTLY